MSLRYFYEKRGEKEKQYFTFYLPSYMIYSWNYALVLWGRKGEQRMDPKRLSFGKWDWIAVSFVVILALGVGLLFLPNSEDIQGSVVQIYQEGTLLRELPLTGEETVEIGGKYENTVTICDGSVSVTYSTCPGEDCVHSGAISKAGRSLVCLPNALEIRITGTPEIDFVVG